LKNKFYTLHLHCSLGPRVDPWLGGPETDPTASPYRDAYERAYHACYGPNTSAPLRDPNRGGLVSELVNNFERVGFDAAPDLLAWLESRRPRVYRRLLEADAAQVREFGHGGALAVPYPPLLLPLAPARDRRTAVRWGLEDFENRFGRRAEGMWLPENAVDDDTLELLVEEGLRFTVVARTQAARVRPVGADSVEAWTDVLPERLDPRRPYRWSSKARPGSWLGVFAYRTDLSPRPMLEKNALTENDDAAVDSCQSFANRFVDSLTANDAAELAHLAVDGEWFGLVHPYGERALAFTLDLLEREAPARRANYATFLDLFPPPQEIDLKPASARSCAHGLGRWRGSCACLDSAAGGEWISPLREALERAQRETTEAALSIAAPLTADPERALDGAAPVLFSSDTEAVEDYLETASRRHPTPEQARSLLRCAEIRRSALASLGHWTWQGDGPDSVEGVEALASVARAVDVLRLEDPARAEAIESSLISDLERVPRGEGSNCADLFRSVFAARRADAKRVATHEALFRALSERVPGLPRLDAPNFARSSELLARRDRPSRDGNSSLFVFRVFSRDLRTFETFEGTAAVFDNGGTDLECRLGPSENCEKTAAALADIFVSQDPEAARRDAAERLGSTAWALDGLIGETRRAAVRELSARRGGDAEADEVRARWLELLSALDRSEEDPGKIASLLADSAPLSNDPEAVRGFDRIRRHLALSAAAFAESPSSESVAEIRSLLEAARDSRLPLNVWEIRDLGRSGLIRGARVLPPEERGALLSLLELAETSLKEDRWSPAN
jgi:hypothetical protein